MSLVQATAEAVRIYETLSGTFASSPYVKGKMAHSQYAMQGAVCVSCRWRVSGLCDSLCAVFVTVLARGC